MSYSIDSTTDGCYPGTTCLINKLGIQDETELADTEAAIVLGKASLLDQQPLPGSFDFEHYKRIHRFLFCDLYDWAGQIYARSTFRRKEPLLFPPWRSNRALMRASSAWLISAARDCPIVSWRKR